MEKIAKTRRTALYLDLGAMVIGMALLLAGTRFVVPVWVLAGGGILALALLVAAIVLLLRVRRDERRLIKEYEDEVAGTLDNAAERTGKSAEKRAEKEVEP